MSASSRRPPSSESSRRCPQLPVELWVRILSYFANSNVIPHVWLSCRRVSRAVRAATEEAFLRRHLKPRTHIKFHGLYLVRMPALAPDSRHGNMRRHSLTLEFDRLSEDRTRAVFSEKVDSEDEYEDEDEDGDGDEDKDAEERQVERGRLKAAWRGAVERYQSAENGYIPPYTITVRQIVNDTELPDLEVDYEKSEMSFDWRAMFDQLFSEECYAMKLNSNMRGDAQKSEAAVIQRSIKSGETDLFDGLSQMMRTISAREGEAYRTARHIRARRWHKKQAGRELPQDDFAAFQESEKLKELKIARRYDTYEAESEDDGFQDERTEVYDEGMGLSRFQIGDDHNIAPFADWQQDLGNEDDAENDFEDWLRTSMPTNMIQQFPGPGDDSDSEASYESYEDADQTRH